MVGEFIIDGTINATETYGVFIREGGFDGLFSLPKIKQPEIIDWAEEHGIEVDLSDIYLNPVEFEIKFGALKSADITSFINFITNKAYHDFSFEELGITKKLRVVSVGEYNGSLFSLTSFSIIFSEDIPMADYEYLAPIAGGYGSQGYMIDGIDLSSYGIAVLQGTESEIIKISNPKKNLSVDISTRNGVEYDSDAVTNTAKDVKLNLFIRSDSASTFFRNINAFVYDLTQPNKKVFTFGRNVKTYDCYYKDSGVTNVRVSGGIWFEFYITLCFISFKIEKYIYLLRAYGKLKASDNTFIKNEQIIIFDELNDDETLNDIMSMQKTYNATTGKVSITVTSTKKTVLFSYSNGKLTVQ